MTTLVLFDIDGTLVLSGGAGARAVTRAFRDVFHLEEFHPVPMAGRTDHWVFSELARRHHVDLDAGASARLRDVYLTHLAREVRAPHPEKGVLPGVLAVLDALQAREDVCVGLLSGNLARGAQIKLEHFDLWRYFAGGGFGDTSIEREALLADAFVDIARTTGVTFTPRETVIVGDTPLDVAVAVAAGARSLAVATGGYREADLRASGADIVLPDLADLTTVMAALGGSVALS